MRFPRLEHLDLESVELDFEYARGLDMYRHVSTGSWSYEPDVLALLLCLVSRNGGGRFINVGANMGYFSLLVKKLFGASVDVHAYEPMPDLIRRLHTAQQQNGIEVHVEGSALADFQGSAPFHLSAKSDTSNSLNPDFRPAKDVIDVAVSTLDAEFAPAKRRGRFSRKQAEPGTVLLIDTESTEPAVLRGGLAFIDRVRPAIICEVLAGRTESALSEIVDQIDYASYALTNDGPERRDEVVGDRSYEHRDWLFLPQEAAPPSVDCFRATFSALAGVE